MIAENSQDLIAILDTNGVLQYASPSHIRVLEGKTPSFEGNDVFSMVHPDDLAHIRERWDEMMSSKTSVHIEWRFAKFDGTSTWLEGIATPILTADREIESILVTGREITERKIQEEKLHQSENRYRALVELSPDAIFVHIGGKIVYANQSCAELLATKGVNDLIGRSLLDFIHPEDREKALYRIEHGMSAEGNTSGSVEGRYIRFDGIEIDVEAVGVGILYDNEHAVQLLVRDITERKVQERKIRESEQRYRDISERLAESEAQYRLLAENAHDLIGVVDMEGIVLYASPSHEWVLGFSSSEYEGNSAFNFVHPDDLAYVKKQFDDMVTLKSSFDFEWRCKKADGSWVYIETRGTPIFDENHEVMQCVYASRDISERRKTEEIFLRSEKLSVVGQMAAGVAHEFRNPLTAIKGFAQLLQKGNEKPLYIDVILSEVQRLEAIVGGFLTLAKPQVPKMQEVDVAVVLQQVVLLLSTQSPLRNVEVIQEHDTEVPRIYCDTNQIKQVFINILQNAVEAMPNGGIIKIQILNHDSEFIKLRFIDQGCGISSERIKSIGEPFYSFKEKGAGLGLMVCNKIVHEHGGSIHIESTINEGATVDVILPVKR